MKKLLLPSALALFLMAGPAQAGYFAFHADISQHFEDVLTGNHGRPDSDDCDTIDPDTGEVVCDDEAPTIDFGYWVQYFSNLFFGA